MFMSVIGAASRNGIAGSTLVEVMISILLVATAVASTTPIMISAHIAPVEDDIRRQMSLSARQLKETLRNYNTPTPTITLGAPGLPAWHLPEDSSCIACWALEDGDHDATAMVPASLRSAYNARMTYRVATVAAPGAKEVRIYVAWNKP